MSDPVAKTPIFTQELEKTRQEQLKAIKEAHTKLTNDQINDESQKEELEALKQNEKSLELYPPKVKEDGKVETTQEYKTRVREELKKENQQLEKNLVELSGKKDTLTKQETVLNGVKNNFLDSNPTESLRQAGFSDEEIENLQSSRDKRIAEQEKLQKKADALKNIDTNNPSNIDEESLQEAGFSETEVEELRKLINIDGTSEYEQYKTDIDNKIKALKAITNAENEKLKKADLKSEDLKTDEAIKEKLEAIKEQKENLTKVQKALEARQKEVEKLQKIQDTPETPDTNGTNNDSNPQAQPNSDGGCQGGNCGRQARRGIFKNKASIMVVAATELAALQIDYSQFLS